MERHFLLYFLPPPTKRTLQRQRRHADCPNCYADFLCFHICCLSIISKSIVKQGGVANYRGTVRLHKDATNCRSHIECDTLILDDISRSDTIPTNEVKNNTSFIEHEATVSKINEDQLFYLMSRGLSEKEATQMIIMGFIEPILVAIDNEELTNTIREQFKQNLE